MTTKEIQENLQFKDHCVLNLDGVNLDTSIYRVFPH